jgi:hypothetical protein
MLVQPLRTATECEVDLVGSNRVVEWAWSLDAANLLDVTDAPLNFDT